MNKALGICMLIFLLGGKLALSNSKFATRACKHESPNMLRRAAIELFLSHKYNESYKLFDSYCSRFHGDMKDLKVDLDDAFNEVKTKNTVEPKSLTQLPGQLDCDLTMATMMQLFCTFGFPTNEGCTLTLPSLAKHHSSVEAAP
jgi:hypothetical protein